FPPLDSANFSVGCVSTYMRICRLPGSDISTVVIQFSCLSYFSKVAFSDEHGVCQRTSDCLLTSQIKLSSCHPRRRAGSRFTQIYEILCFAQKDNTGRLGVL